MELRECRGRVFDITHGEIRRTLDAPQQASVLAEPGMAPPIPDAADETEGLPIPTGPTEIPEISHSTNENGEDS